VGSGRRAKEEVWTLKEERGKREERKKKREYRKTTS
jgi:hypothetical protein